MVDTLTPEQRSARMAGIRGKDTGPELLVRRALHSLGYRFRLHRKDLPGRPDIVLPKWRTAILVHGCFWHGHTDAACGLARMPKSRVGFWGSKIASNQNRDRRAVEGLQALGWRVVVIWECELRNRKDLRAMLANRLEEAGCARSSCLLERGGSELV